jgi:hypothetical protein
MRTYRQDHLTTALTIIDTPHHEIHEGEHFFYADSAEIASAGTQDYLLTTGSTKYVHLGIAVDGSAITKWDMYEASDKTGTTIQTTFNNKRTDTGVATMTVHKATSGGTTDGTLIWTHKGGAATGATAVAGTSAQSSSEMILKQSTKYIIRVTSGTNNNLTNIKLGWYEESSN